jgi:toxin ParE1/3/4
MPRLRILEAAAREAFEAAAWYELQQTGLGVEFEAAIEAALDVLEADVTPLGAMPGSAGRRGAKRLTLRRFPFDVVIVEREHELVVIAFAHQARRPGYWRGQLRA